MLLAVNFFMLILISSVCTLRADSVCLGSHGERVAATQRKLKDTGFYEGEISGICDFATRKAIKTFQGQNNLNQSGEADYETFSVLGLNAKSGGICFSYETELLARYIRLSGNTNYPDMLKIGEELLKKAYPEPLGQYILNSDKKFFRKIFNVEPTSECYSCALQVIRQTKITDNKS